MIDLLEATERVKEAAVDWLPRLAGGIGLLILGWLCAIIVRFLMRRLLRGLQSIVPKRFSAFEASTLRTFSRAETVFPVVLYWFILLFFAAAAAETMGLPILTAWIAQVISYLPKIFMALVIVFGGFWGGSAAGNLTTRALGRLPHASMFGRLTQISLVILSAVLAINQLGIDLTFLTTLTGIVLAGLLLAAALAFGLGARDLVGNILASHYVQKIYGVGQEIDIEGVSGTIVEITDTFVMMDTPQGRVTVPAKLFAQSKSTRLSKPS